MSKNHYQTLGISTEASKEEIKSAFRKLVKQQHPDKTANKQSGEDFDKILAAYQVLNDESEKRYYDQKLAIMTTPFRTSKPRNTASPANSRGYYKTQAEHTVNWVYIVSIVAIYGSLLFLVSIVR